MADNRSDFELLREGPIWWPIDPRLMMRCDSENSLDESSQKLSSDQDKANTSVYTNSQHTQKAFEMMLSMRNQKLLCDVVLVAGSEEIYAHKMVLAACSPYFYAMFHRFDERKRGRIHLKDFDPLALKLIIDYVYTSAIRVTEDNVQSLLPAANLLQLTDIRDACCVFLESQLHPTNCLGIRAFADLHNCTNLFNKSENYIERYFKDVVESEEFLALSHQQVKKLVSCDQLGIPSEEIVFESVISWTLHDKNRLQHLPELMENVRFPLMQYKYLVERVSSHPLMKKDLKCLELVIEALTFQLLKAKGEKEIPLEIRNINPRKPDSSKLLLVLGGQAPKAVRSVECYDFEKDRWYNLAEMPSRRCRGGVSVINNQVYSVGGFNGMNRVRTLEKYDALKDQWETLPSMQTRRSTVGVGELKGLIYAVGGFDGTTGLSSVEIYNPSTEEWRMITPMPSKRSSVGVGVLNNLLYAVGGYDGTSRQCLNSVICYNPDTEVWTRVADMSENRSGAAIGVVDGIMYAIGGHDGPVASKSVEAYNPKTNTWSPVADMTVCRRNAAVVCISNMLYVVGGDDGKTNFAFVEYYHPKSDTWSILPSLMSIGRSYPGVAVIEKPV